MLEKVKPSSEEIDYIHELYKAKVLSTVGTNEVTLMDMVDRTRLQILEKAAGEMPATAAGEANHRAIIPLHKTRLTTSVLGHPQDQNTAGRIFGGFLMRQAYETAFSS